MLLNHSIVESPARESVGTVQRRCIAAIKIPEFFIRGKALVFADKK
jgi:hypothetical protein